MQNAARRENHVPNAINRAKLPLLLNLLLDKGRLVEEQVTELLTHQKDRSITLEATLLECGIAGMEEIAQVYAEHFSLPMASVAELTRAEKERKEKKAEKEAKEKAKEGSGEEDEEAEDAPQEVTLETILPDTFCWEKRVTPLRIIDDVLEVAIADPTDYQVISQIRLFTGKQVEAFVAPLNLIEEHLHALFGERDFLKEIVQEAGVMGDDDEVGGSAKNVIDLSAALSGEIDSQVVRLVNQILLGAYREAASDIHIEPTDEQVIIRYRIDGKLTETTPVPRHLVIPLISRLKVISKLDIAEKRVPQDGAFSARVDNDEFDVRVSTVPVVWGEKIVMRLLNKGNVNMEFESLGFNKKQRDDMIKGISHHNGLVFVTGPTGSGKSTTLYTALSYLNDVTKNIMTAEDPVEYKFPGINQVHIRHNVGLTFAAALRSFLRQDPDIIMVGEVRDNETAEICMRAALTGHLVISTLHTNSALDSISRLCDMGAPPFLIAATLRLIEAQRLARRLCKNCKRPVEAEEHIARIFKFEPGTIIYQAEGCEECRGGGYKGRVGLYEIIPVDTELSSLIANSATYDEMVALCRKRQIQMLDDSAIEKVLKGETSVEEIWQFAGGGH